MLKLQNKIPSALTIGGKIVERIKMRNEVVWEKVQLEYLYIENVDETDGQITFTTIASNTLPSSNLYSNKVEYSSDKKNWNTINFDTTTPQVIPINIGEKLYFRNNSGSFNYLDNGYYITTITTTNKSNVGGNLNTLLKYNEEILDISGKPGCFYTLFKESRIVDASNLVMPATTLSDDCYYEFFYGNSSLIAAPELPAVNLAKKCYYRFFYECSSLTVSPSLPATTLADGCYSYMYERCYKLTTAPVLVATTLVPNCYNWMFSRCSKLSSVTIYAKTIANDATVFDVLDYWLNNVASSGTIYNNGLLYMPERTSSGVPSGWKEEFPPMESVTANPNTFTIKSFETRVECDCTITITTTTGITTTVNDKTTVIVGENTGDSTRTLTKTLNYRGGIPYEVTIIQTANDVKPPASWNVVSTGTYPFELNTNGYYESTNKGKSNSYSYATLNYEGFNKLVLECINSGESNYDYGIISQPDVQLSESTTDDGSSESTKVFKNFKYQGSANPVKLTIPSDGGSHFITIKFIKDGSGDTGNDSLQFKVIEP